MCVKICIQTPDEFFKAGFTRYIQDLVVLIPRRIEFLDNPKEADIVILRRHEIGKDFSFLARKSYGIINICPAIEEDLRLPDGDVHIFENMPGFEDFLHSRIFLKSAKYPRVEGGLSLGSWN